MEEGHVENILFISIVEEMVFSWHVILLIPICPPLPKNREAWINLELYTLSCPKRMRTAYIPNIIIVRQPPNIIRHLSRDLLYRMLPTLRIIILIIDSPKLSLHTCRLIKYRIMLIHSDISPMRYLNRALSILKDGDRIIVFIVNSEQSVRERLKVFEGPELDMFTRLAE